MMTLTFVLQDSGTKYSLIYQTKKIVSVLEFHYTTNLQYFEQQEGFFDIHAKKNDTNIYT